VGNRTKLTDPDSGDTTYLYDNANRLTSLTNADNQTTTFLYDALDRVTKQTHHNGTYATYAFNAAGDLTQLEHRASGGGLLSTFSYLYNNVGNLTQASETVGGNSATTTYLYDALDRLTQEKRTTSNAYWYEYLYDAAGNRTKFVQKDTSGNQTGSKGYAYDAANKLTLEGDLSAPGANGNIQYTFDSNGNLTKKQIVGDGSTTYLYDFENHLTKLNDGVTLTFTYDGDGVRKSLTNGSLTTRFIHDFDGLTVLAETDGNGNTTATYTHGLGLISQRRGSTTSYYHADLLGTTRQMTNSSQTVTDSYVFDAWGNALSSTGSTANPYRFAGQWGYYDDGASGLMLLGARYYDAGVGRFITQDPIGDGLNWYGYVDNNPVNLIDPEGLSIWDWRIWPWNWFGGGDKRWQQQMERDRSWSEWLFDKLGWNPPQPQNPDPTSGGHAFGVYAANQTGLRVTQQNTQTVAPHLIPGGTFGIGGPAQFAGVRPSPSAQPALPPAPQIRTRPALPPVPVRPALPPAPRTQAQKNALWRAAPGIYRQHFGRIPTDELGRAFQIHHRIPLEWAHLFPRLNPNNIDNLMALPPAVHERVNAIWTWFRNALGGQRPTQQQVLNVVRSIDCVIDDLLY
jgi:RHS repeat-associated protein